jgi:glycosyltransferase involved in cell wall biosynthesis
MNNMPSGARQRFSGIYGELIARLPEAEFVIYEPVDCKVSSWFSGAPNVSARPTPIPSEGRVRKQISGWHYWRSHLQAEGFDFFEMFSLPLVKSPGGRTLLTVHDIRGLHPVSGLLERTAYKLLLKKSLQAADHVITVSESMKNEISDVCPGIAISVVYNGLDLASYQSIPETAMLAVRQRYDLPQDFVLTVGHFEVRKNYLRLVEAMARLRDRGLSFPLVIIGNDSGFRHKVAAQIHSTGLDRSVKLLSGLDDLEVKCLFKLCSLFVFPSVYEGFGIPVLESMAAGRPMVLSDIPPFREITEDRGVYFPHDNVELMANAIEKVLSSNSERERLVAYGRQRVQSFTFHNLAAQVENLYRTLM